METNLQIAVCLLYQCPYSRGICNDDFCVHRQWHSLTLVVAYSDTHLLNELVDGLDSFLQVVRDAVFILQIPGMCKKSIKV